MTGSTGNERFVAAPGVALGQYALVRELGAGGMGRVFEAKHVQLGKRVAIKILHQALIASPKAMRRFLREGRACSRVDHPHVVDVLDTGVHEGQPYLVMELVEGENLAAKLREKQMLDRAELANIFLPLCSALWAVHQRGIVHRDLKPSNVILTRPRLHVLHPMLVDFGIAKLSFAETTDDLTKENAAIGTVAYMAPEQVRNAQSAQPMTDQYALGVMLYEAATGRRPFQGESQYELLHAILHAAIVPPSKYRSDLGQEFDALVLRALSRNPAERFSSVHALGGALLALGGDRAWSTWGPEFCGSDAPGGSTVADAPRREPRPSLTSDPALAPLNLGSFTPSSAASRKSPRLRAVGGASLLAAGLVVCLRLLIPAADAAIEREIAAPPEILPRPAPELIVKRAGQPTSTIVTKRGATPSRGDAQQRSSQRRKPATSKAGVAKPSSSSNAEDSLVEPPRGTNGAFILE